MASWLCFASPDRGFETRTHLSVPGRAKEYILGSGRVGSILCLSGIATFDRFLQTSNFPFFFFPFSAMFSLVTVVGFVLASVPVIASPAGTSFESCLRPKLSPSASLIAAQSDVIVPRWTEYKEFNTGHIVNVSTEADVQAAVSAVICTSSCRCTY